MIVLINLMTMWATIFRAHVDDSVAGAPLVHLLGHGGTHPHLTILPWPR